MRERIAARVARLMRRLENSVYDKQVVRGRHIKIPLVSGLRCGMSEEWMIDVLDILLAMQDGAFIDVGVNVGQTLVKLRALDSLRKYVGFEPNPICVFYVSELIRMNSFGGCTVLPVGLSTSAAVLRLNLFSATAADSAASIIPDFRPGQKVLGSAFVSVFRFEQVAPLLDVEKVGIIKIDVEGAELEVLTSLSSEITKHRPVVLLEVLPAYSPENQVRIDRQEEIGRMLATWDYVIFRVQKTERDGYRGLSPLERFDIHSDLTLCDYVLVPREGAQRVQRAADAHRVLEGRES